MSKLLIFYYNKEIIPVLENTDLLGKDIEDINIITFQNVHKSFHDERIRFSKLETIEESIDDADKIWIVNSKDTGIIDKYLEFTIQKSILQNKEIFWSYEKYISNKLSEYPLLKNLINQNTYEELSGSKELFDINTSIIFVLGFSENTNKYNTLLSLHKELKIQDLNVYTLSARKSKDFDDINTLPGFIYDCNVNTTDKILFLNHYICNIENTIHPDLILIEVPGGIGRYSRKLVNGFGEYLFIFSNAIPSDCNILNLPVDNYNHSYFIDINNLLVNKYDLEIDFFNIINKRLRFDDSHMIHEFCYLNVGDDIVENIISKIKKQNNNINNIFNLNNKKEVCLLTDKIIEILSSYADNQIL